MVVPAPTGYPYSRVVVSPRKQKLDGPLALNWNRERGGIGGIQHPRGVGMPGHKSGRSRAHHEIPKSAFSDEKKLQPLRYRTTKHCLRLRDVIIGGHDWNPCSPCVTKYRRRGFIFEGSSAAEILPSYVIDRQDEEGPNGKTIMTDKRSTFTLEHHTNSHGNPAGNRSRDESVLSGTVG